MPPSLPDSVLLFVILAVLAYIVFSYEKKDLGNAGKSKEVEEEGRMVRVCPRCGSTDIELDRDTHKAAAEFGGKLYYKCNKCGLIQPTFPLMTEEEAEEYEKEMKKT